MDKAWAVSSQRKPATASPSEFFQILAHLRSLAPVNTAPPPITTRPGCPHLLPPPASLHILKLKGKDTHTKILREIDIPHTQTYTRQTQRDILSPSDRHTHWQKQTYTNHSRHTAQRQTYSPHKGLKPVKKISTGTEREHRGLRDSSWSEIRWKTEGKRKPKGAAGLYCPHRWLSTFIYDVV